MKTGSMDINQRKDIEMTVKPLSFCTFFVKEINVWVRFPFQINLQDLFGHSYAQSPFILTIKMTRKAMELKSFWIQNRITKWNNLVKVIILITSPRERNRLFVF